MSRDYSIVNEVAPKVFEMLTPVYEKGYDAGYNDAVLDGAKAPKYTIEDIQKVVDKIAKEESDGGYSTAQLSDIFGFISPTTIFETYTLTRIMEKVAEYEDSSFEVGDIVKTPGGYTAVVTKVNDNSTCNLMYYDGDVTECRDMYTLTKIGRSGFKYTMTKILDELKELNIKELNK